MKGYIPIVMALPETQSANVSVTDSKLDRLNPVNVLKESSLIRSGSGGHGENRASAVNENKACIKNA